MGKILQIQLGDYRPVDYFEAEEAFEFQRGELVILEVERGAEHGKVVSLTNVPCKEKVEKIAGKVLRKATEGDIIQVKNNHMKAQDSMNTCIRKITDRKLKMKIIKAEYSFDCSKIIFYFSADGRVDFRGLVKDLAKVFRVRIELKQIGVRDKAKVVGGYGVCGRELCCSSYMKDFHQLSIKMAKDQNLPLNPSRISGVCGRIKCCMAYEFTVYREYARNLPRVGDKYNSEEGKGKVIDVNVLKRIVAVDFGEGKVSRIQIPQPHEN